MDNLLIFFQIVNMGVLLYVLMKVTDLRDHVTDLLVQYEGEEQTSSDEQELESEADALHEQYMEEREKAFNARITQMKNELGNQATPRKPSTVAPVLHSDVENLPHDSIIDYQTNPPDVEYTL